ncbi:hypothetical protein HQN89_17690 [Paenibacillus frigoriresistens]|uniref:hypothetical protein n=1 Tax=Paenibacillus alginolyticus TaxID=59839 RepID=UPI000647ECAE|nr:hypothetical protein [Paenibacillus frigoriresistens]NRF92826.1 hypothetical protein [Paenibacillus frigoriresistens]
MDVHTYERWQRVWKWWVENALYKLEPNWFTSLEAAPQDAPNGARISVMEEVRTDYEWRDGKWVQIQIISQENCKLMFG